jgi:hypothetical protein
MSWLSLHGHRTQRVMVRVRPSLPRFAHTETDIVVFDGLTGMGLSIN